MQNTNERVMEELYLKIDALEKEKKALSDAIEQSCVSLNGLSAILFGLSTADESIVDSRSLISAISFVGDSIFEISKKLEEI